MNGKNNQSEGEVKANFDDIYCSPTPHAYIKTMATLDYQIGERAAPFCLTAAKLIEEKNNGAFPVKILDIGCSYGIGSLFIKFGLTFKDIIDFYESRAHPEYSKCVQSTRNWLSAKKPVIHPFIVGQDSSDSAVRFALDTGLIDIGITKDFETCELSNTDECALLHQCNLIICVGTVGYITELSFSKILEHAGTDCEGNAGPFFVMTVLRMFDTTSISRVFEKFGFGFKRLAEVCLPQRRFIDAQEKQKILALLNKKQIDTSNLEDTGMLYADVFIAAPRNQFQELYHTMMKKKNIVP